MIRVLFVDDDRDVLAGLQNRLRKMRHVWDMSFACGASEALSEHDVCAVDAVVTDMRMPGMDGAELLARVQELTPTAARIVLSGQSSQEQLPRALRVAHQYLAKPCKSETLVRTLSSVLSARSLVGDPQTRQRVGELQGLPSAPALFVRLNHLLSAGEPSFHEVTGVIETEPALCARLLQITNSAFFGLGRPVKAVQDAVALLGLDAIANLLLTLELIGDMVERVPGEFCVENLQRHSVAVAQLAAGLVQSDQAKREVFSVAMLHDLGRLVWAVTQPEQHSDGLSQTGAATSEPVSEINTSNATESLSGQPLVEPNSRPLTAQGEVRACGFSHAHLGAYLLGLWGLPSAVVSAVAHHHEPLAMSRQKTFAGAPDRRDRAGSAESPATDLRDQRLADASRLRVVDAVHLADALAHELTNPETTSESRLSPAFVEALGGEEFVSSARATALALAEGDTHV